MRPFSPLLLLFSLCACGTVHSPVPFGPEPFALDPAEWDGTWCTVDGMRVSSSAPVELGTESGCTRMTVVDPVHGVLDVLVRDGDDGPELERLHLRAIAEQDKEAFAWQESGGDFEFLGRVRRQDQSLIVWDVTAHGFVEDVNGGRLPGRTEDSSVWLQAVDSDAVARIAADEAGRYFDWRSPLIFVRVAEQ
jgi:hypothetical protein